MNKEFIIQTRESNQIHADISGMEYLQTRPAIIFIHGFKGFKDWGFGPYLAEYFSNAGFPVIRFNFSHNGIGENPLEFTELAKFAENTYSLEISELKQIIDAYLTGFFGPQPYGNFFLIGHSRGCGIVLLTASYSPYMLGLVLWAPISTVDRYSRRQKDEWRERGYVEALNTRTGQEMRLNSTLLDDIEQHKDTTLNIMAAAKQLQKPALIIHGEQDLAVPIAEARAIYSAIPPGKAKILVLEKTGHTFDIAHPFEKCSFSFNIVLTNTLDFLKKQL
jgi:pimeloyl-ACP methyl ester carboxylesterase